MKLIITAFYDKKLGVYGSPDFRTDASDEDLIEVTRRMCANPKMSPIFFEYDLYRLGSFDDKTGIIEICEKPVYLCSLGDFAHLAAKESEVADHVS